MNRNKSTKRLVALTFRLPSTNLPNSYILGAIFWAHTLLYVRLIDHRFFVLLVVAEKCSSLHLAYAAVTSFSFILSFNLPFVPNSYFTSLNTCLR